MQLSFRKQRLRRKLKALKETGEDTGEKGDKVKNKLISIVAKHKEMEKNALEKEDRRINAKKKRKREHSNEDDASKLKKKKK